MKIRSTYFTFLSLCNLHDAPEEAIKLRRLIKSSNESLEPYLFGKFEFWNFFGLRAKLPRGVCTEKPWSYEEEMMINKRLCLKVSTTPLQQWVFWQCLTFSWTTPIGKHCHHPIAVMEVVDMFGDSAGMLLKTLQSVIFSSSPQSTYTIH